VSLNEFLKEHHKNEEQEATIAQLKSGIEALAAMVKEQASQIQKVSAQLEANKPAPQVVNNR
jgi:precorrin-4 methylase